MHVSYLKTPCSSHRRRFINHVLLLPPNNTHRSTNDQQDASGTARRCFHFHSPLSSPPTSPIHLFSFPALSNDGTLHDPHKYFATPPAALSTRGYKMAHSLSDSLSSLDDASYDMVDDISEVSSDGHETVSIASTNDRDDDEAEEEADMNIHITDEQRAQLMLSEQQAFKVRMPYHDSLGLDPAESKHLSSSSLADLDTPKQSILEQDASQLTERGHGEVCPPSDGLTATWARYKRAMAKHDEKLALILETYKVKDEQPTLEHSNVRAAVQRVVTLPTIPVVFVALAILYACSVLRLYAGYWSTPYNEFNRTQGLEANFHRLPVLYGHANAINYTHLFPERQVLGKDMIGLPYYGTKEVHYQVLGSRVMLVSMPEYLPYSYPCVVSAKAARGQELIHVQVEQLSKGVYGIAVHPKNAHGLINITLSSVKPSINYLIKHDFGNRFLHGSTYQLAGKELSKAITKDIAVARDVAKTIGTNLQPDISGKIHNMSLILQSAVTDLSIFVNKTALGLHKAEKEGKELALRAEQELVVMTKDLQVAYHKAIRSAKSMLPNMKTVVEPLILSRERALMLSEKLFGHKRSRTGYRVRSRAQQVRTTVKADAKALRREHRKIKKAERKAKLAA